MAEEQAELPTKDHEMEEEKETSEKEDESEEEESDDGEYFEVEKIMSRKKRDGIFLYRVRWKGYPPSNDTWEPVDNLDVVQDMVEEFDAKEEQKAKSRQEERRLRKLRMEGKKLPGEESSDSSNSSDDERLLNEDTKFFKMLEKNKDFVFGQPDLYSKVKSRAATLANKKKIEESRKPASADKSKTAQAQPARKDGSRGRSRGRLEKKTEQVQNKNRNRRTKKAVSKDSEEESDDSPVQRKATGRAKGRPKRRATSEEDTGSDDSSTAGKGRGQVRPKKSRSSDEEADSDDSSDLRKDKRRGKPGKKTAVEQSEENETDSDDVVPLRSVGKQKKKFRIESSEENASDSSLIHKKRSKPVASPEKTETAKKSAATKKTAAKRTHSPISEKDSEKSSSDSEGEQQASVKSDKVPVTSEGSDRVSPVRQNQEEKICDEAASPKSASESSTSTTSKSISGRPSPVTCLVQPRFIVPVLEKLALSSQLEERGEDTKYKHREEKSSSSSSKSEAALEESKESPEMESTKAESMEIETPQKKDDAKESKKRANSSRKRKQDTAAEHSRAVNEGEASPVKTSPTHSLCEQPCESDPPVLSREPRTSEVMEGSGEDATVNALPPVLQRSGQEKKVPPLRITVPKLKLESSRLKPESPKPYHHHNVPKSQSGSGKLEKVKLKEGGKSGKHDHHTSGSVLKTPHSSKRPPSRENVPEPAPTVTLSFTSCVTTGTSSSVTKRDPTPRALMCTGMSHHQPGAARPDLSLKFGRTLAVESAAMKVEGVSSKAPKPELVDNRSGRTDHIDPKTGRVDSAEPRKKYSSGSEVASNLTASRDSACGTYPPSSVKDLPSPSRDSLLSPSSRNTSGVFSSGASTSRETSGLYTGLRDSSILGRGGSFAPLSLGRDLTHTTPTSFKDSLFTSGSCRDSHLVLGSSSRDFHPSSGSPGDVRLGAGYIHLSSGSFQTGRDAHSGRGDSKDSCAGGSRYTLSSSITGKENADRLHGIKSLSSMPKKGDSVQPLDTILNSTLYDGDKSRQYKGLDSDFDLALQRIDLEYLEKLLLPPVTPMELSDEELRQAVIDGNCYLVERALACSKPYNLDMPDNKGYTLLMNAVLRGSDDIIVHLLSRGADAQVQVNGVTALMLAVEHAESSTVFMLLEMGAHVNAADVSGETALFKAVRRGDKQILKLLLDHGANFSLISRLGLSPLQMAKQFRLADVETTLIDHIHKVVRSFEEQVNLTVRGTAKLVSCLFPHHCVPLYESDTITIPFKYQPTMPTGPGMGCLLFIAHARFNPQDVKCRLYGQCAVERVTLNGVLQPCLTEESNFVLMCHPLITGWNELVIHTKKDPMSKAKLIVCAYKAQLIYK